MNELFYTAFDVACIVNNFDLTDKFSAKLIRNLWQEDNKFLLKKYQKNYRQWFIDVRYWSDYLYDKVIFDKEFPAIQSDFKFLKAENFITDNFNIDLFFKTLRVKILYFSEKKYSRMKLRTLLSEYGYKRRSKEFISYIKKCLEFYQIKISFRGKICDLSEINLDDMITFKI